MSINQVNFKKNDWLLLNDNRLLKILEVSKYRYNHFKDYNIINGLIIDIENYKKYKIDNKDTKALEIKENEILLESIEKYNIETISIFENVLIKEINFNNKLLNDLEINIKLENNG